MTPYKGNDQQKSQKQSTSKKIAAKPNLSYCPFRRKSIKLENAEVSKFYSKTKINNSLFGNHQYRIIIVFKMQ